MLMGLLSEVSIWEIAYTAIYFTWVIAVVYFISRAFYDFGVKRGVPHKNMVYYNRKLIHVLAGGVVALLVPFTFKTPILPFTMALLLALLTYIPHRVGRLLYWFQVEDNSYEVHFCLSWGLMILLSWIVFNNYWYGVLPVLFMAFGDGVTGVVRNLVYKRRTKSWLGNLAMAALSIPLGAAIMSIPGALAGAVASIVEHFEYKFIDDNITVPLSAFTVLFVFTRLMPLSI